MYIYIYIEIRVWFVVFLYMAYSCVEVWEVYGFSCDMAFKGLGLSSFAKMHMADKRCWITT